VGYRTWISLSRFQMLQSCTTLFRRTGRSVWTAWCISCGAEGRSSRLVSLCCRAPGVCVVLRRSQDATPQRDVRTTICVTNYASLSAELLKAVVVLGASGLLGFAGCLVICRLFGGLQGVCGLQAVWWYAGCLVFCRVFGGLQGCLVVCRLFSGLLGCLVVCRVFGVLKGVGLLGCLVVCRLFSGLLGCLVVCRVFGVLQGVWWSAGCLVVCWVVWWSAGLFGGLHRCLMFYRTVWWSAGLFDVLHVV